MKNKMTTVNIWVQPSHASDLFAVIKKLEQINDTLDDYFTQREEINLTTRSGDDWIQISVDLEMFYKLTMKFSKLMLELN